MFKFYLCANGTLANLTFNEKNDNRTIGELPKMIKLFFPQLEKSLYQVLPQKPARLLQEDKDSTNKSYTANITDEGTTLNSSMTEEPTEASNINATHDVNTSAHFDKDGNLLGGSMQGVTLLQSTPPPEGAGSQNLNLPASIQISQGLSFSTLSTFGNLTDQNIIRFASFFTVFV